MFRNLKVVGLGASASHFSTIGSVLNPVVAIEKLQTLRHPPLRNILSGFEGVVRPGEMLREFYVLCVYSTSYHPLLVVLGSPGSGCTTFLKMLANQRSEYHSVQGEVCYDSLSPTEVANHYRGDVQYCPEDDVHFASLTVEQTINFAAMTRVPQSRIFESRTMYADVLTHMLTTIFGLRHALNTPVGDAIIRGISGGEKKRVSIAEALATRSRITCWDKSDSLF
jgi:ATP-binding cassette, subfamily G (WHITE), member 2, SNQ2